jgi:1,4-dihydroxy-2-naphthoate octaprenyltransferase
LLVQKLKVFQQDYKALNTILSSMSSASMIKVPLYLVSIIPVIYAWIKTWFKNPFLFALIVIFALASQLSMNIEMDLEDQKRGMKCFESEPLLNVGPCHVILFKQNHLNIIRKASLAAMLIIAVVVLAFTRMLILLLYGLAGIVLMYAYLKKPLELYKRGVGEVSTFFDFGPILVLGSLYSSPRSLFEQRTYTFSRFRTYSVLHKVFPSYSGRSRRLQKKKVLPLRSRFAAGTFILNSFESS